MALKDLKSILSDFRIPKKTPLDKKPMADINKGGNQTPLGGMLESTPKVAIAKTTPNKNGADTTPIKQGDKFKGETNPTPMDNSMKFLGETNTKPMSLEERYLGETNTTKTNTSEKFLGETTQTPSDNSSNFLGETTQTPSDNSSNFLGETTQTPANNSSNFLGETTQTPANNSSNFLGEVTPTPSDNSSNFLGETTPSSVNYFSDIHATGFTSPFGGVDASKYVGVNPDNTVFNGSTSLFGEIGNINGFTPNLFHRAPSKFTGVDSAGTLWDSTTSIFSNHTLPDTALSFGTGYKEFQSKKKSGNTQQYTPDSANYEASYKSIGTTMEQRNSPSFLDLMYAKYNLREDAYNSGLTLFNHPLILRGIQRKGISKGEPQNWGIGGVTFDDGMIRGGIITSTVRAAVDVARIGAWMSSIKGILWGARQAGLQLSQKFGKIWTPAGLLASIGGQHFGLKAQRPGLIPLVDDTFQYQNSFATRLLLGDYKDKLETMHTMDMGILGNVTDITQRFSTQTQIGGPNSVYGIGISGTRRYENTFNSAGKRDANAAANVKSILTPLAPELTPYTDLSNYTIGTTLQKLTDPDLMDFGVAKLVTDIKFKGGGLNLQDKKEVIQDYETIAYGKIPERVAGSGKAEDFRSLLTDGVTDNKTRADNENYEKFNINKRVHFPNPGLVADTQDRYTWHNVEKNSAGNSTRFDKIQASGIDDKDYGDGNDLVHLWFTDENGGSKIQFRGTVSGITDSFSPSWDSYKYNGRADSAYQYKSFERSLSFNMQVYATSRIEMKPIYSKLGRLASMTMPTYSGSAGYQGSIIKFRLGNLYFGELAFIESLTYSMSDETPWDISLKGSEDFIGELPMGIDVAIGLKILGKEQPKYTHKVYGY